MHGWSIGEPSGCPVAGPEPDVLEKVRLRASELTSCEWCTVRKLPVIFLQTTASECLRLRSQLRMSRERSLWYDCKSTGGRLGTRSLCFVDRCVFPSHASEHHPAADSLFKPRRSGVSLRV